jgi:hypothetical protein
MTLCGAVIRSAGLLVPAQQRPEWLAEWTAELWYVRRVREDAAFAFCLGAFRDAFCLRVNFRRPRLLESPLQCGLLLAVLAAASALVGFSLSGESPYRHSRSLVLVSAGGPINLTTSFADYRFLESRAEERFRGMAFYRPVRMRTASAELTVAQVTGNLFELLGIPASRPGLVLSDRAWRKYFGSNPDLVGRVIGIGGQEAVVTGIIPADSWRLPGRVDAWLPASSQPARSRGYVLGRLRAVGMSSVAVVNDDGGFDYYDCQSLAARARQPWFTFLTALFYICVFLPATTSMALGATRLRQWLFLAAKALCILPMLYCCAALACAFSGTLFGAICFIVMFPGSILAFRWVLEDQRRRCPVCLRLLSKPVGFGDASHTFLRWYGTELTCVRGHGLLRVPEIPSTYFSTQRWVEIDDLYLNEVGLQA